MMRMIRWKMHRLCSGGCKT